MKRAWRCGSESAGAWKVGGCHVYVEATEIGLEESVVANAPSTEDLPAPSVQNIIDQCQCSLLVCLLERIANDFRAGVLGVHFVYQALEVVLGFGGAGIDHGCTVGGELVNDSTAYGLRGTSSNADEAILPQRLAMHDTLSAKTRRRTSFPSVR